MLKNSIVLDQEVGFIIPKEEGFESVINLIQVRLCNKFGGASQYEMSGSWLDDNGKLHQDTSIYLYANTDKETLQKEKQFYQACADFIGETLNQLAVSVKINGTLHIVDIK